MLIYGGKPENIDDTLGGRYIKKHNITSNLSHKDKIRAQVKLHKQVYRNNYCDECNYNSDEEVDEYQSDNDNIFGGNLHNNLHNNLNNNNEELHKKFNIPEVDFELPELKEFNKELVDNRLMMYITKIEECRKLDEKYLPFDDKKKYEHKQFIKNIVLTYLRESGSTHLINDLFKDEKYHCPRRLYNWLSNTWVPSIKTIKNIDIDLPPINPDYKPRIAFYDLGIYEILDEIKPMCLEIEKYYTVLYEYIFSIQSKM